jgi:hypothetical protein
MRPTSNPDVEVEPRIAKLSPALAGNTDESTGPHEPHAVGA